MYSYASYLSFVVPEPDITKSQALYVFSYLIIEAGLDSSLSENPSFMLNYFHYNSSLIFIINQFDLSFGRESVTFLFKLNKSIGEVIAETEELQSGSPFSVCLCVGSRCLDGVQATLF